jgi:hypothetical protein
MELHKYQFEFHLQSLRYWNFRILIDCFDIFVGFNCTAAKWARHLIQCSKYAGDEACEYEELYLMESTTRLELKLPLIGLFYVLVKVPVRFLVKNYPRTTQ